MATKTTKTTKDGSGKIRSPSLLQIKSGSIKSLKSSAEEVSRPGRGTTTERTIKRGKKQVASATNAELRTESKPVSDPEVERRVQCDQIDVLGTKPTVDATVSPRALPMPLQAVRFALDMQLLVARTMILPWLLFR